MVLIKKIDGFSEKSKQSYFYDRLYYSLTEDGVNINYGDFNSKILNNGVIKVLKSLGIYKVTGVGDNKKILVHPKLNLIIDTTINSNEVVAKTTIDLCLGKFKDIENFSSVELTNFKLLPNNKFFVSQPVFGTYIIFNPNSNLFKIGKTKRISKRLVALRNEFGKELNLIAFRGLDIEMELHEKYKDKRIFGEWFSMNQDDVESICSEYNFILNITTIK